MSTKKVLFLVLFLVLFFFTLTLRSFAFSFSLVGIKGTKLNIDNFKGKIVVATFFNVNCHYCQEEISVLNKLYGLFGKNQKDVVIMGIDTSDDIEQINAFGKELGVKYPLYFGSYAQMNSLKVFGTPTSIFVNKQSVLVGRIPGQMSKENFIKIIKSIQ